MPSQLLVNVITATVPPFAVSYPVAHGLRSNDKAVAPTLVLPQGQSAVLAVSADETNVYLTNASGVDVAITLRCERDLSMQADAASVTPFYMSTGAPGGGVATLSVVAPIANTGTATDPVLSLPNGSLTDAKIAAANKDGLVAVPSMRTLGTGAQQACAGNDSRLSFTTLMNANLPNSSGDFGAGNDVFLSPSGGPFNIVTPAPGKFLSFQAGVNGYVTNGTASQIRIFISLCYGPTGSGTLATAYLFIPAGGTASMLPVLNSYPSFLSYSASDVRVRLQSSVLSASVTYSVPFGGSIRVFSQG